MRTLHHIAKGSAYEVAAVFDVGLRFCAIPAELAQQGHAGCDRLAAMISRYH